MFLGAALLILGALIGYWLCGERDRVEALQRDRLQVQARVIDENLGRQLEGVNNALAGVRDDYPLSDRKSIGPAASRRLKVLADAMAGVTTMLVLDAEGTVLATSRDELIGRNFSQREYFKVARADPDPATLYVSPPFKTVRGVFSIIVARVATGSKGEFAGIVSALLDPEYFNVLLQSVLYAPDMSTAIVHGDGKAFLHIPVGGPVPGADLAKPGSFFSRHRETGQTATVLTGITLSTGDDRMMAMRTFKRANLSIDKPLIIAVSRNLSAIYAPWRKDVLLDSGLYAVIALTAILGLTFTQRRQRKLDRVEADHERDRRESAERHELALRASEEKYRGIYDSLQDLYVETDLDGTILDIGPQVEELSGGLYKREDLLGRSAKAFYSDPERRTAFLRTLTLTGSVKDFESTLLNRDGSVVPFSISAMIRLDAEGKPGRIVSMMRDITLRNRAEASLRESEERLRAMFEAAADGILVADTGSGKFQAGNPAICRMLGYTLQEIPHLGVSDIHPKAELARLIAEFKRLQRGESELAADFPVIRKDGSTFPADMHLAPIRLGGKDCGLAIIRDISERRRAEEDLQRIAEELRNAYRRLSQAQETERRAITKELHDQVGQNLSALNLNLHYIDRELSDAERSGLKGRLDDCLVLLDETVARVRSVMGNLRPPMLDEFGLFATLRWLAHETTQRSGIPCTLAGPDWAQRLPAEVESTLVRIAQEALMNAVKYSKAHEIRIALTATPRQVQMEIADDGIGFDPLDRDASASKPTWGLTTMRERADALGGRVQVISAPGEGTRVVAEIPREPA
jgi:PAS domain S-box-containing protein